MRHPQLAFEELFGPPANFVADPLAMKRSTKKNISPAAYTPA
ncbi:unnamed protein product [Acidithrix sp. C25]|nr:unnamed protein product [Acidithrix sp. C25]